MQTGYFRAAWNDIKNTPNWFGKLMLLSLVSCIPVFGIIVMSGYLYGWARDIAWGIHRPMPRNIFGNEDGKLYSRGFFVLVIAVICSLLPFVVDLIFGTVTSFSSMAFGRGFGGHMGGGFFMVAGFASLLFSVLIMAVWFIALLFMWVGSMRTSIYGRISAGLQFSKIWAMIRHDIRGLLRILGMTLVVALVVGVVFFALLFVLVMFAVFMSLMASGGNAYSVNMPVGGATWGLIFAAGGFAIFVMVVVGFLLMVFSVFSEMLLSRALGYWTRQFDVPAWRGQDDPMPFEVQQAACVPRQASVGQSAAYAAPQQQAYVPDQQQPSAVSPEPASEEPKPVVEGGSPKAE